MSAASADEAIATPIAALNNVAPMRRRRARARNSGLVAFIFLVFLISSAVLPDAISDAQSLRATALQSMKWLTEYFAERVMNISALNLRQRLSAEYLACKRSIRPGCPWSASRTAVRRRRARNTSLLRCRQIADKKFQTFAVDCSMPCHDHDIVQVELM